MSSTAPKVVLKDLLFHPGNVARVASEIANIEPGFDADRFTADVVARFGDLELKQRIAWIAECLHAHLPANYLQAVGVLLAALPAPCDPTLGDGDFGDFIYAPYSLFVARHGCTLQHVDVSLSAIRAITTRFSAEDAIRPFLDTFPEQTFAALREWATDSHYHVRRLCSEGTRPRLPWSTRLAMPAVAAVPILDVLFADPTRFVTRSVANHVNDIAKDDPDLALDLLERWRHSERQTESEMAFIVRHATRSLVKQGNQRALRLIGVEPDATATIRNLTCTAMVELGGTLEFAFDLAGDDSTDLVVDYAIEFPGATGRIGRKVFKLRRVRTTAGTPVTVTNRHRLRADMTTRRIVPGVHQLDILVNGRSLARTSFTVAAPAV